MEYSDSFAALAAANCLLSATAALGPTVLQLGLTVFDIFFLEDLASARVLIFLDDLRCLISVSVDLCFLGYGLSSSIFDNRLLAYRLAAHSASESTEAAGLETGEAATAAKASSEHVIVH